MEPHHPLETLVSLDCLTDAEFELVLRAALLLGRPVALEEAHVLSMSGILDPLDPLLDEQASCSEVCARTKRSVSTLRILSNGRRTTL